MNSNSRTPAPSPAERQLADTTVHLKAMFDAISEGIVVLDRDGVMTEINRSAERIFGVGREQLLGRHAFEPEVGRFHEDGRVFQVEDFPGAIALRTGLPQRQTVMRLELPRGSVWISINVQPMIRPEETEPFAVIVSFSDITLRKELAEREQDLRGKLTHALRINALGETVTGLAHELNQPLTAIATYAYVAQQSLNDSSNSPFEEARALLFKITDESVRAGEIIKRLRNFIRNRQAQLSLCELPQLLSDVVSLFDYELKTLGIHLECNLEQDLPSVMADKVQTQQVLMNLLRNAIDSLKNADREIRQISISLVRSLSDPGELFVRVTDNGPGIPSELRPRIFEPYLTTKNEGLGLGLPISRTIIESQGGRLELIESTPRETTFQFSLRVATSV